MKNDDFKSLQRIHWGEYFMQLAVAAADKALDDMEVGAVIVRDELVIATGFNGFPRGIPSEQEAELVMKAASSSNRSDNDEKNGWMVHAEQNAIFNAARLGVATKDATMYVTHRPCFSCQKAIVQAGIKTVWVKDMKAWSNEPIDNPDGDLSKHLCKHSGLKMAHVDDSAPESANDTIPRSKKAS